MFMSVEDYWGPHTKTQRSRRHVNKSIRRLRSNTGRKKVVLNEGLVYSDHSFDLYSMSVTCAHSYCVFLAGVKLCLLSVSALRRHGPLLLLLLPGYTEKSSWTQWGDDIEFGGALVPLLSSRQQLPSIKTKTLFLQSISARRTNIFYDLNISNFGFSMTSIGVLSQFSSTDIHMCSQSRHVITSFMFCHPRTSEAVALNQILIPSQYHMLHFADKGFENCPGSVRSTWATSVSEVKSLEILLRFLDQPWRHQCSWSTQNTSTHVGSVS